MSGQLEVHHSALCTAPVSLNLCCRGPYPQPGHSPREVLTLRPILLWQLRSSRSNAKRYCDVYMVTLYSCLLEQQGPVYAPPGRAGREKWHSGRRRRRGRKKIIAEEIWNPHPRSLVTPSRSSCSKSFLSVLYKSWCLFLRELLRVVTVLEVSSASSSSFASRTSLKNLKMVLKLTQEVSSCRSVPTCKRHTHTNISMSRVHKVLAYCKAIEKKNGGHMVEYGGHSNIITHGGLDAIHLLWQHKRWKKANA